MDVIPLSWEIGALFALLAAAAFFSIAETSMMAINRYKLKHLVAQNHGGARRVAALLARTDRLLGAILIGNTLVSAAAATLAGVIAVRFLGDDKVTYALSTVAVSFLIIIFSEITPKVIGATYPERIALPLSYLLGPLQKLLQPGVWLSNLFVQPMLKPAAHPARPGGAPPLARGDPHAGARILELHAEKAPVDPDEPVRRQRDHGARRDGAARENRGDPAGRRHGDDRAPAHHQLPPGAAGVPRQQR